MYPPRPTYKDIKLLGTRLDTKTDIQTRKARVWEPIKKFKHYFKSRRLSVGHKVRVYKTYVEPILLYNSETWTLTPTLEKTVDSFHRRLLRVIINVRYPKIITNEKLCMLTKEPPISETIRKRWLALLGHILRLHPDTPAQKALRYYMTPHPRPVGRPPMTWIALITKDLQATLKTHRIKTPLTATSLEKLMILAEDRNLWRNEIVRSR